MASKSDPDERYAHEVLFGRFVVHSPYRDQPNGPYYVRVRDLASGRVVRRSSRCTTVRGARQFARDWLAEVIEREAEAPEEGQLLGEAAEEWIGQLDIRGTTRAGYLSYLRAWGEGFPSSALTTDIAGREIQDFLAKLADRGLTWRSRRNHLVTLRAFFRWCIVRGIATEDPTRNIRIAKGDVEERVALSVEQARALLSHLRGESRLAAIVALRAGLRMRNVLGLRWEQIDLPKRRILISGSEMKGKRDLVVPLHRELSLELPKRPSACDRLIPRSGQTVRVHLRRAVQAAGLPHTRFHDLRHSFATWLARIAPEDIVARVLGHARASITQHYIHRDWSELLDAVDQLPPLFGEASP